METLVLPVRRHLVRNDENGSRRSRQEWEGIFERVARIWRQAGIELKVTGWFEPRLDIFSLEEAYPTPSEIKDRVASCYRIMTASAHDPDALNLYVLERVPFYGASETIATSTIFDRVRCALVAEKYVQIPCEILAALTIGRFFGLRITKEGPPDALMHCKTAGSALSEEEVRVARTWVQENFGNKPAETSSKPAQAEPARGPVQAAPAAPPAAPASLVSEPLPELVLPVRLYLVKNQRFGTLCSRARVEERLAQANKTLAGLGLKLEAAAFVHPTLSDGDLEQAFPQAGDSKSDCAALSRLTEHHPRHLHLFCVGTIQQTGGTHTYRGHAFPPQNLAIVSDHGNLSHAAAVLLGVSWKQAEDLGKASFGNDLISKMRTAAQQLLPRSTDDYKIVEVPPGDNLEKVLRDLDNLVGLQEVKKQVRTLANFLRIEEMRRERGASTEPITLHTMLLGNPGTGKTTLARLLGRIFKAVGALPRGHILETDRSGLVGETVLRTSQKVHEAADKARGGVLFVDEAYNLVLNANDPSGQMAVQTLLKRMEEERDRLAVVLAGYQDSMLEFLNLNSGLQSRVRHQFELGDYPPHELAAIFKSMLAARSFKLAAGAEERLDEVLDRIYRARDKHFGNGRLVRNLLEGALERQADRLIEVQDITDEQLFTLEPEDIPDKVFFRHKPDKKLDMGHLVISEPPVDDSLEKALGELDQLIGLENVKKQVRALADLYRVEKMRKSKQPVSLHLVFTGPPGTGKTTVARLMGRIFRQLDLLPRGHVIETDRSGLVAGWVGQTSLKTNEVVNRSLGGVLFLDEAYTLAEHEGAVHNWGREALAVLLKRMEDSRDRLCVIFAGYPEPMEKLLESNPGLVSRFNHRIEFPSYTLEELVAIFESFCEQRRLVIHEDAHEAIAHYLEHALKGGGENFANGRVVRNLLENMLQNQATRLATADVVDDVGELRAEDVPEYKDEKAKPKLGFRQNF